jgi:methylglutaconyl-CoA hydratase
VSAVKVQRDDRDVLHVTLDQPETRNAFTTELVDELTSAMAAASADNSVRAVVLSGAGPCFCAGGDVESLRRMASFTLDENLADSWRMDRLFRTTDECAAPVIAKVHKAARGGGVGLVACADIAIATEGTTFGFSETRLGIIPAVVGTYSLPKLQWSWARRLLISGEVFDAATAERIGLLHEVVPADQVDARVDAVLAEVLAAKPGAQRLMKSLLRTYLNEMTNRDETSARSVENAAAARTSQEGRAGLEAFLSARSERRT